MLLHALWQPKKLNKRFNGIWFKQKTCFKTNSNRYKNKKSQHYVLRLFVGGE